MAVTQRLEFRQTQSLVMTPQLQQAIKLLQLSNMELADYVESELEQNPLLERDDRDPSDPGDRDEAAVSPDVRADGERLADTLDHARSDHLPEGGEQPLDTDYENVYDNAPSDDWGDTGEAASTGASAFQRTGERGGAYDGDGASLEQRLSEAPTLRQHLLNQVQMDISDPVDRMIAVHLIDMLDGAGYLDGELSAIADLLGCEVARVEATLRVVQRFDPAGVFARSLRECLALQLADRDRFDPAMAALVDNLDLLAGRQLAKLKRICGVDDEDLAEMITELRALDPKPALTFDSEITEPVIPDILMRAQAGGGWHIELNSETLPRVLINSQYHATVSRQARDKADREYISQCFQSANWLVKSLHQRATTILKVSTEIVRQQDAFFRKGIAHMRPLTLRDVADAIEMHESTVSRVTSNKYMVTPRGTYELKYFFTAAIAGMSGDAHSAEAVRHRIKKLIDAESRDQVLSDDRITDILRKEGVDIARRTVAKYREAMRIPSSMQRKREKTLGFP